jgi:hypothetical protein
MPMHRILLFLFTAFVLKSFAQVVQPTNSANAPELNVPIELKETQQEGDYRTKEFEQSKKMEVPQIESKSSVKQSNVSIAQMFQKTVAQLELSHLTTRKSNSSRSPLPNEQQRKLYLLNQLYNIDNQSFEYNYFKYVSGNYNFNLFPHLQRAYELQPTNNEVLVELVAYHWILNDKKKAMPLIEKLFVSGRLEVCLKDYAEELLLSVPENGLLITHGVEDTYAVLFVQESKKLRSDVLVVSLDWFQNSQIREFANSQYYELPSTNQIDVNYLIQFCQLNSNKNISLSFTLPSPYLKPLKSNLFVHGLVAVYSNDPYRYNWGEINANLFNQFDLNRLKIGRTPKEFQLARNYLPMFYTLKNQYSTTNVNTDNVDQLIKEIEGHSKKE